MRGLSVPGRCRLACPDTPSDIGTRDRTDGTYLFEKGLAHYVRARSVRSDKTFPTHSQAHDYRIPRLRTLGE